MQPVACCSTTVANEVFPHPGGPQRMSDGSEPSARSGAKVASVSSCPINSSSLRGRMRSASGAEDALRLVRRAALAGSSLSLDAVRFLPPIDKASTCAPVDLQWMSLPYRNAAVERDGASGSQDASRHELRWSLISALATCLEHTGHATKADERDDSSYAKAIARASARAG